MCRSELEGCFSAASAAGASRQHGRALRTMRHVLPSWISGMRPTPIRIEMRRLLLLFTHFHAGTVSHFSVLDCLAPSVRATRTAPSDAFQANLIQFEETKMSQLKWETMVNRSQSEYDR
jgi:hypothetical protein